MKTILSKILDNATVFFITIFYIFSITRNVCITFSDGCLGSRNDEERSEMRYVMRIAESVNHQNFERILRFRVNWKHSCLSVCSSFSLNLNGLWAYYVQLLYVRLK